MKKGIHPQYHQGTVTCGTCGTVWNVGSTRQNMRLSICANCHPFYTGEQRKIVDTEGQVDRFMKRLAATQERQAETARRQQDRQPKQPQKKSLLQEIYGQESSEQASTETTE